MLIIFQNFQIFQNFEIRDGSLIEMFTFGENQSFLFLKLVCVTGFPENAYFRLKWVKHDVTLTSLMADVSGLASFPFVTMCQIDGFEGIENLEMIRA